MKLLREPLVHFVLLGALVFGAYTLGRNARSSDASHRIEITGDVVQLIVANFERRWQRPPTEQELTALVEGQVREEVLYREALTVGLDQNDMVVRRRMVQKMELLTQDLALLADPTDQELQAFFEERQEDYRLPPRVSFSHVYFNFDRRGPAAEDDAKRILAELRAESPTPERAPERGDRFMLQHDYALRSPREIQQLFGSRFAEAMADLQPGWHGPVPSGYGLHLVYVSDRLPGRTPDFGEVRERLVNDYNRHRSERAKEALFEGLRANYVIEIDEEAVREAALQTSTAGSEPR